MTPSESIFVSQSTTFVSLMLQQLSISRLEDLPVHSLSMASEVEPILIQDLARLSDKELAAIRDAYNSPVGVAALVPKTASSVEQLPKTQHPLHSIAAQLASVIPTHHALEHPLERHPEVSKRFGALDGTVKVYNLPKPSGTDSYREQGETSDAFEIHHDGLGSAGTVETVFLYCDSAPLTGGFTYFQNIGRLSLDLARQDPEAFQSLFLPNAVSILRPRGKGALKVTCPVLYINDCGKAQSSYRRSTGEYRVTWRSDVPPLGRARDFLNASTNGFAGGSTFVHFTLPGQCCLIRNGLVAHGRTSFVDGVDAMQRRCLSRKWFMRTAEDAIYKHVPGLRIAEPYASLFPDICGTDVTTGEWRYDGNTDRNCVITKGVSSEGLP